jgi:hypothetical protein
LVDNFKGLFDNKVREVIKIKELLISWKWFKDEWVLANNKINFDNYDQNSFLFYNRNNSLIYVFSMK